MAALVFPTSDVRTSFLAAMAEFRAEGRGGADDPSSMGEELRTHRWEDASQFGAYVGALRADVLEESARREGWVPCTTLWWVEGDEYIGRLAIRHRLTEWLTEFGGHIGYDVRASRRREGHATAMLRAALPVAADLGIDPALITCDVGNVASRLVIERNGGELDDQRGEKLRYWVSTRPGRHAAAS